MTPRQTAYAVALVAALLLPLAVYPVFLMTLLCFALFACAFNLLFGFTNLLSFGHAAFFGWSAYVAGYVLASLGWSTGLGLVAGTAVGAALGLVIGALVIRHQGISFSMATLALSQMLYFFAERAPFTGGENGLQGVPRGSLFGLDLHSDMALYYVVLAIAVACYALIMRVVSSPFGHVLQAIKENEPRARSLGYEVDRYKLVAFVLSAALSGLAGAMKSVVLGFATLTDVHWATSGAVLLMVLVGGKGTLTGPVVGAVIMVWLDNRLVNFGNFLGRATSIDWFNQLGRSVTMVTGLIFIVCVLAFRGGVVGNIASHFLQRVRKSKPAPSRMEGAHADST
jgi:branched-chain amino acid transport system permease protein